MLGQQPGGQASASFDREKGFEPLPAQAEIVNHLAILQ